MKMAVQLSLILVILFSLASSINSAVLGIDFGTEYIKSSLISPGKSFMIIEDMTSKRKTPSSLCFAQQKRFYEYECGSKRHRNPQSTFLSLRKYLTYSGKHSEQLQQYTESNYEFLNTSYNSEKNRYELWFSPALPHSLTFQQITSMVLKHLKQNVQRMSEIKIKDIVMTIPYISDPEMNLHMRQALLEAVELAGLNLLGFIHENTAATVYLAVERMDSVPTNVLMINIGSGAMQISIGQLLKANSTAKKELQTVRMLSQVTEEKVSGYILDQTIAHILAKKFDAKRGANKPSIFENKIAMIKLHKESEKIKEVLSANKEMNVYVENIVDGDDFHTLITRQEFEKETSHLQREIVNALEFALEKANFSLSDIHEVELIGGVVRVPKIQQILSDFLSPQKLELGQHLNGDEAMALGAAFHAANMSHSFRVRPLWLFDEFDFDIKLQITTLDDDIASEHYYNKSTVIFPKRTKFETRKVIAFRYDHNVKCEFFAVTDDGEYKFQSFIFNNISAIQEDPRYETLGKPKLNFQFILNTIDPIELEVAEAVYVEQIEVQVPSDKNMKKEKKSQKVEDIKDDEDEILKSKLKQESEANQSSQDAMVNNTTNENSTNENTINETIDNTTSEMNKSVEEPTMQTKLKNKTSYIDLKWKEQLLSYHRLNGSEFRAAKKVIKELDESEELLQKNAKAKNELESLIYTIQSYKDDEMFATHSKDEERTLLFELAETNDDWLYTNEATASNYTEFNKKHLEMSKAFKAILNRVEHSKARPQLIETSKQKLESQSKKADNLNKTMPWVDSEEMESLILLIEETKEWFDDKIQKQSILPLFEEPIFTKGDMDYKLKDIDDELARIKKIKKPKKEKNKTKKSKATNESEEANLTAEENSSKETNEETKTESKNQNDKKIIDDEENLEGFEELKLEDDELQKPSKKQKQKIQDRDDL